MNVILLASGKGKRLNPETNNLPKPLVLINEKSILDFFLDAFEKITKTKKLYIATGHKEECFNSSQYQKVFNPKYESTNMLYGLWFTLSQLGNILEDTIISYGDIVFPNTLLEELSQMEEITIVTDPTWKKDYVGRNLHGFEECEKCIVDNNKNLLLASKNLPKQFSKYSEYIGVFYIPKKFMSSILNILNGLFLENENLEKPFMFSKSLNKSYITDFLSYLIINNFTIKAKEIFGNWNEIDTVQDLFKVKEIYL